MQCGIQLTISALARALHERAVDLEILACRPRPVASPAAASPPARSAWTRPSAWPLSHRQLQHIRARRAEGRRGDQRLRIGERDLAGPRLLAPLDRRRGPGRRGRRRRRLRAAARSGRGGSPYPAQPRRYVLPGWTVIRSTPAADFSCGASSAFEHERIAVWRAAACSTWRRLGFFMCPILSQQGKRFHPYCRLRKDRPALPPRVQRLRPHRRPDALHRRELPVPDVPAARPASIELRPPTAAPTRSASGRAPTGPRS